MDKFLNHFPSIIWLCRWSQFSAPTLYCHFLPLHSPQTPDNKVSFIFKQYLALIFRSDFHKHCHLLSSPSCHVAMYILPLLASLRLQHIMCKLYTLIKWYLLLLLISFTVGHKLDLNGWWENWWPRALVNVQPENIEDGGRNRWK